MASKLFLLFFLSIIDIITSEELQYKLTIVDEKLKEAAYITPVISEKGFLYILTGDKEEEEKYQPKAKTYNRIILKFDINSGALVYRYSFNNLSYPFLYGESIMVGNNSEYLLTSTKYSIEVWENTNYQQSEYEVFGPRRFIKQDGDSFYYGFIRKNLQDLMQIIRMQLTYDDSNKFKGIQIMDISNDVKVLAYEEMISCDFTEDKENIVCIYISEDLFFYISVFKKNFGLLLNVKKESVNGKNLKYFMKIVYFKDNSRFIIINSQGDYITRLRYHKYVNNELINLLSPLIYSDSPYLDVDETQLDGYHYSNDIIAVDSDKIYKIFTSNDIIILTIFQFYNYDSLLHIKIYNMKGFNTYGFNYFSNPRIAMFRDSLLICLKTTYNNMETTGFLFLNYPTSKDISLQENTIKIKDLISIENNIFLLNLKFKILEIPKDFIFLSKLKSQEVKENEDLEVDDELILRQYRINEGPYILKYEGISLGDDLKFSSSKIYPKGNEIPPISDIYIEGRHGQIEINFKQCLDKYYRLDTDLNLCTDVKPEGSYLDENEKIFKSCESPCQECYGPKINYTHMNCKTCKENYIITEDSNSCYDILPDYYYLDEDDDIYRRCHPKCLKCISGSTDDNNMSCLECIYEEGIFYRRDTHNCISLDQIEGKTKFKDLKIQSSTFFIFFLLILLTSIISTIIIILFCCCKETNDGNEYHPVNNRENINNNNRNHNNDINTNHNNNGEGNEMENFGNNGIN